MARGLTLVNTGDGALRIASIDVRGIAFTTSVDSATVAAGDSLQVEVAYAPREEGMHTGMLTIFSNDPEKPQVRMLLSGGTLGSKGPKIAVIAEVDLGTVIVGGSALGELKIGNGGDMRLAIDSVRVDDESFSPDLNELVVAPGSDRSIFIRFAPAEEGEAPATLFIHSDDPLLPVVQVKLTGDGEVPLEGPISMDFHLASGDQGERVAGNAAAGDVYELQLNVDDAPPINGWSATIAYDPGQVRYVKDSFQASDFIPDLLELVDENPGAVSVGGTVLKGGAGGSGDRTLGTLSFELLEGFADSTELVITEISFRQLDGEDYIQIVRSTSTITSRSLAGLLIGDFDGNDQVDFQDFFLFADAFGGRDPLYDLDGNDQVDFQDFFLFVDNFGREVKRKEVD